MGWWRKGSGSTRSGGANGDGEAAIVDAPGKATRRELEALFSFSRKLVGAAGLGEVAQALFRAADDLLGFDEAVLLTIDDAQERATGVVAMSGIDVGIDRFVVDLHDDTSAIARVVRDRAPHRVLDGERERLHHRELAELLGLRSAVYVPLQTSGGVIAVAVFGTRDVRPIRREEVELVQKLASDAAVAIERARFAQALRDVGERELVVAGLARHIRETLDPAEVLRVAAGELGEQTDADRVLIRTLWSDEVDALSCTWTREGGVVIEPFDDRDLRGSARLAIDDQQTVPARADRGAAAGTEVSLPLVHREQVLGVLTLDRNHSAFDVAEQRLIELVAIEIGAVLEYVRLHQGGRRHLEEQVALARAAQTLTADLRFDRVIEHLVDEVVKVLRTNSAAFYAYDREERTLTLLAAHGEAERRAVGETMGLVGLAGRVVQSGVSQYTNAYAHDLEGDIHPAFEQVTRAMSVPVRWQGDLRGVVSVASRDTARLFTQHDVALLETFADLASLALHNADAYGANSRQARIQAGFYRISQILGSSLSRAETLDALAQAATEALDGAWSIVVGGDGVTEELHVEGSYGAPAEVLASLSTPDRLRDTPATLALSFRRVVTSRTVRDDDRLGVPWRALMDEAGIESHLAVPVSVHGRHSASVVVCFDRQVRFGDEELVVGGNLGSAAAAALERAGLFENEQRARRLAEVLAEVSGLLADTLKAQEVLERIVEQTAVLIGVDACALAVVQRAPGTPFGEERGDDDALQLVVHSAAGADDSLVAALQNSPVGGLVEEVARGAGAVGVEDLASETDAQPLRGEQFASFLGVPLLHPRGALIGVLSAYCRRRRPWTEAEVSALESFASTAAIAIRNAELYQGIKRERDTIETLLASIAEGIVATDGNGRVTLWNSAAESITGVTREQAVGRAWRDVLGLDADTVVDDGTATISARPSGSQMYLSVTASKLRDRGRDSGAIYAFRDVSAGYALDQLKADFVSTVSFRFRTPLTSISGFAKTLLRDDLELGDADRRVFLEYIASETDRLTEIVEDLLEVARIDDGSVEVHLRDCDIAEVVGDVAARCAEAHPNHRIDVMRISPDVASELVARADVEKLEAVLENLVDNAVGLTPEGGDVMVEAHRDNGSVQIRVTDTGGGMAPNEQKHMFTKFSMSPHTNASGRRGSGLRMYISRGLVSAMGGRIWVSSQSGTGSTFTVELPAARD
jgi:PAS domain S-box-containing protein